MGNLRKSKITQGVFDAVKICLESGNTAAETAKFMKLSCDVVYMIRDAENLAEYRDMMTAKCNKYKQVSAIKAKEAEKAQRTKPEAQALQDDKQKGGTLSANYQINRIFELLKRQTETLELISNKLAFIVDELTK